MDDVKLLPCPFCQQSGPCKVVYGSDLSGLNHFISCACGARSPNGDEEFCTEWWNTRAPTADQPEPVAAGGPTCQRCGGRIEGWTCQGCGEGFKENDAGCLVLAQPGDPVEARQSASDTDREGE